MSVETSKLHQQTPPSMMPSTRIILRTPGVRLNNGRSIPLIGLGTWQAEEKKVKAAVKEAIEMGYRHIDCAAIYGNESAVGEALEECFREDICRREELFVTSKLWNDSHGDQATVTQALDQTLKNLRLDYLDMYLIHWPIPMRKGEDFKFYTLDERPLEETWLSMESCVLAGKTKGIGVSNFSAPKLQKILNICTITPAINQVEHHPYLQQNDLVEFCRQHNIHVTGYSPLCSTNHKPAEEVSALLENPTITTIAKHLNATPAQVVLRWAMMQQISVIPKSTHRERIQQNLASIDVTLTESEMEAIGKLDASVRTVSGDLFTSKPGCPFTKEQIWDE